MNSLSGEIVSITVRGSISLVKVNVGELVLTSIVIDTPESLSYLRCGNTVNVIFKETEVLIGKGSEHMISLQNRILGKVKNIESDELLSKITVDSEAGLIESIITTNAVDQLGLIEGTQVTAMIKTNEVMLSE